ncbi:uncharacterized protein LY89DRAFT_766505 [Mollisia scopiformis]|uniref:Uncharacterized protein n=1 Tax=Mollisia scopiformis TaxID=149040 RepID=A0A132B4J7_MOLSC|nr:uncharacterized protein LY89DRAFT_766505 [Mollisia scopiformis]KUJ07335.1 hypothetical protein LY89DRAFT_766505 [Mollisia scopiformis]
MSVKRLANSLETSSRDPRLYRVIELGNKVQATLIHDPKTDQASVTMNVNVGSMRDDNDMPGLAHAHPNVNAFREHIAIHSGKFSAYTSDISTVYSFRVMETKRNEPDCNQSEGEKNDKEKFPGKKLDAEQLHTVTLSSTTQLETLKTQPEAKGVNIRDRFMEFHDKHYLANRSQFVVFANELLDTLEAWVSNLFFRFKNKNLPQNRWETEVLFRESDLMTQCFAKPVTNSRYFDLSFPFIDEECDYESQAGQYINQLISYEGPGGIMACIQSMGWATSIGTCIICPGTPRMFHCKIGLTEKGLKDYREIVVVFFEYVSLLREPQEWFYQELKRNTENKLESKVSVAAKSLTEQISLAMGTKSPTKWLLGIPRMRQFNAPKISEGLTCLTPRQLRLYCLSDIWRSKEKWYGTDYTYEKIPAEFFFQLEAAASFTTKNRFSDLHFPHRNDVLVTDPEVKKEDMGPPAIAPRLIRKDGSIRIWHKKDDHWRPFKMTALTSAKARLFAKVFLDSVNRCSHNFEIQGFKYSVLGHSEGLEIHVAGYNSKLHVLLEELLLKMKNLEAKEDRFEKQVSTIMQWLNTKNHYIEEQILPELPRVTITDVHPQLPPPATSAPVYPSLVLPQGSNFVYNRSLKDPQNTNHCIQWYLDAGDGTQRSLRAKRLGYITWSKCCSLGDSIGFKCTIQSKQRPQYLESRIDMFLTGFMKILKEMHPMKFEQYKAASCNRLTHKFGDLDFELSKEDAAAVNLLTQPDMIEFFERCIDPASPERAKIVIHMNPQNSTTDGPMTVSGRLDGEEENMAIHVGHQGNGTLLKVIPDVADFQSRMPFSCGFQPVKDFKQFERI